MREAYIGKDNLIHNKSAFDPVEVIEKEVKKRYPSLNTDCEALKIAMILIASVNVGADRKKIASLLRIPEKNILKYEKRLRKNKIWEGNKVNSILWAKKKGEIAFWMDVCVARGILKREDYPMCLEA